MQRPPVPSFGSPPPNYISGVGRGETGITTRADVGPPRTTPAVGVIGRGGYVAGLGRGATGFTTRSDLGPMSQHATPEVSFGKPPPGYVAGGGRGMGGSKIEAGDVGPDASMSNDLSDLAGSLFDDSTPYGDDDKEADLIYQAVDEHLESRRKSRCEKRAKAVNDRLRATKPTIQQQFRDAKMQLATVSKEEWDSIPEIGDYTVKRQRRAERFTAAPDSLLAQALQERASLSSTASDVNGAASSIGGSITDLRQVGQARNTVLNVKLEQAAGTESALGKASVDKEGYLTSLAALNVNMASEAEIGDMKKSRLLLKSVTSTNPHHAPGWIAAARLEMFAGKLKEARHIIEEGCRNNPTNEDVWLEFARMSPPDKSKRILAEAVTHCPTSVKIWMAASDLETENKLKTRVFRRALELIPNSVKLWKAAVELEDPESAKVLLSRAVECVPHSVDMWIALAKLETYENAKSVLNKARRTLSAEAVIWFAAARLEEANGGTSRVAGIISKAVKSLESVGTKINRDEWIGEAEAAEHTNAPSTAIALIRAALPIGVEMEDRRSTWVEDSEGLLTRGAPICARAALALATETFPQKKSLWMRAAHLEKLHGTPTSLQEIIARGVSFCPRAEVLWLMAAKERWLCGDVEGARQVLSAAFGANQESEQIWLAASKLESENDEKERARVMLTKARAACGTQRVYLKSAKLERELGNNSGERTILREGLRLFPKFDKLWMMLAQLEERDGNPSVASEVCSAGTSSCPSSVSLWLVAAGIEEARGSVAKARSLLEKARHSIPKCPELWLEAVLLEIRSGDRDHDNGVATEASRLMAKSLQECPASGLLWALQIEMVPRPKRKNVSADALRRCDNDPYVLVAGAKLLLAERKVDRARAWFDRAVALNRDLGDTWAAFYKMEIDQGIEETAKQVEKRCTDAMPTHGRLWTSVNKSLEAERSRWSCSEVLMRVAAKVTFF